MASEFAGVGGWGLGNMTQIEELGVREVVNPVALVG